MGRHGPSPESQVPGEAFHGISTGPKYPHLPLLAHFSLNVLS